jgi:hypothetical protein
VPRRPTLERGGDSHHDTRPSSETEVRSGGVENSYLMGC